MPRLFGLKSPWTGRVSLSCGEHLIWEDLLQAEQGPARGLEDIPGNSGIKHRMTAEVGVGGGGWRCGEGALALLTPPGRPGRQDSLERGPETGDMLGVGGTEGGPWSVAGTAAQLKGRGWGVAQGGSLHGCPQGQSLCTSPDSRSEGGGLRRIPYGSQSVSFIGNKQGTSSMPFLQPSWRCW